MEAQHDLATNLEDHGDLALKAGDLPAATIRFKGSVTITRKLAIDHPRSIEAQHYLLRSLCKLAAATRDRTVIAEAQDIANKLKSGRRLTRSDRAMLDAMSKAHR